jgi:hypothetical protein
VKTSAGARVRGCADGVSRASLRPGRRAFHSSSRLRLHAASLGAAPRVSRYAQTLLLPERSPPCHALRHRRLCAATMPTPNAVGPRPHPGEWRSANVDRSRFSIGRAFVGAVARGVGDALRGHSPGLGCRLREGVGVRGGRSPEIDRPSGRSIESLRSAADAHDRTPREQLRSKTAQGTHPRTRESPHVELRHALHQRIPPPYGPRRRR